MTHNDDSMIWTILLLSLSLLLLLFVYGHSGAKKYFLFRIMKKKRTDETKILLEMELEKYWKWSSWKFIGNGSGNFQNKNA